MVINELGPKRGPIPALAQPPTISLIAAEPDEAVPQGVPVSSLQLPSLDQDTVREWLSEYRGHQVFVVTGKGLATSGTPALALQVSEDEYLTVASAMPR